MYLLGSSVNACLSLISSSMACLLVLLLSVSSSPHCSVLLLRGQPNDGSQGEFLPVLLLQPPGTLVNCMLKRSVMQAGDAVIAQVVTTQLIYRCGSCSAFDNARRHTDVMAG